VDVAFVTGGARGIGRAIVISLAKRGCAVAIADIRADDSKESLAAAEAEGVAAISVSTDVTDGASVNAAIAQATEDLEGAPNILVNCAGWDEAMPFINTTEDLWSRIVEINYLGAVRTTKAVLPGMIEQGYGRIVNIGSDAGRVGSGSEAVYAGAKGGVIAFGKSVAREVARYGITVNTVCPGPTRSPLLLESLEGSAEAQRVLEGMQRAIPMRRLAEPEDIATAVSFFAGRDVGYITGQTLSVSGGLTMS
jgi:2-hydroxycyclohexanecarboxyl-CoA dehydrogenase